MKVKNFIEKIGDFEYRKGDRSFKVDTKRNFIGGVCKAKDFKKIVR